MQQIQYFFRKSNLRGIVASCKNASHLCKYNPIKRKVFESRSQAKTQITGQGNKSTAGCRMTAKLAGTSACSNLRNAYNDCFNRWYSEKFMKGQWDKEECVAEWEAYRACIMKNVEDKNLSRLLKMEATAYPTVSGPGRPLHSEDGSK